MCTGECHSNPVLSPRLLAGLGTVMALKIKNNNKKKTENMDLHDVANDL